MNEAKSQFGSGVGAEVPFSVKGEVSGDEVVEVAVVADGGVKVEEGLPWAAP